MVKKESYSNNFLAISLLFFDLIHTLLVNRKKNSKSDPFLHFAGVYQSNSNCAWKYYGKELYYMCFKTYLNLRWSRSLEHYVGWSARWAHDLDTRLKTWGNLLSCSLLGSLCISRDPWEREPQVFCEKSVKRLEPKHIQPEGLYEEKRHFANSLPSLRALFPRRD